MGRLIIIGFFALGLFFTWRFVSTPPGEQKVIYLPSAKECFSEGSEIGSYCIHRAKQGVNGGVVYILHGRNLDENIWNDDAFYTAMIQKYWSDNLKIPPIVVSVSYGPIWLLTPKGLSEKSGLLETFVNRTIP